MTFCIKITHRNWKPYLCVCVCIYIFKVNDQSDKCFSCAITDKQWGKVYLHPGSEKVYILYDLWVSEVQTNVQLYLLGHCQTQTMEKSLHWVYFIQTHWGCFSFLGINKIKSWWSLTRPRCAIKEWFLLHLDQSHCRWQQNPVPKSTFKDWPLVQQVQFPPFHPFLVGHGHPFHPKTDKADTR